MKIQLSYRHVCVIKAGESQTEKIKTCKKQITQSETGEQQTVERQTGEVHKGEKKSRNYIEKKQQIFYL